MSIKAVILDCDGVILESSSIKADAFLTLFKSRYPKKLDKIAAYHIRNMGISRHAKIRHICTRILGERCPKSRELRLADNYSRLVLGRVLACPLIKGTRTFLRRQFGRRSLHVASGAPQTELNLILRRRGLLGFFESVWGSPAKKPAVIRKIMREGSFRKSEVVFVGDAESDWRAARQTGVSFVRRIDPATDWPLPPCRWEIENLEQLSAVLKAMERARR